MRRGLVLVLALTAHLALLQTPAYAGSPESLAADIAREVMSPYCPGVTVHDCPSDQAVELRDRIADWARAGMNREEILARLEAEYGESIRAAPPARGAGLLAWLLPALAVATGAFVAWRAARRWTGGKPFPSGEAPRPSPEPSLEDRARLERELRRLER